MNKALFGSHPKLCTSLSRLVSEHKIIGPSFGLGSSLLLFNDKYSSWITLDHDKSSSLEDKFLIFISASCCIEVTSSGSPIPKHIFRITDTACLWQKGFVSTGVILILSFKHIFHTGACLY